MKRNTIILLLMLLLFASCNESIITLFSLKEVEFSTTKKDSLVIMVDSDGPEIELTGTLNLVDGKCVISMASPIIDTTYKDVFTLDYDTVYSDTSYTINVIQQIDTVFDNDTIFNIDTIWSINTIDTIKVDSIYVADTIFSILTIISNKIVYQETFNTSNKFTIDQKFNRIKGTWKFKYSIESIEKGINPYGDLEFDIKYQD